MHGTPAARRRNAAPAVSRTAAISRAGPCPCPPAPDPDPGMKLSLEDPPPGATGGAGAGRSGERAGSVPRPACVPSALALRPVAAAAVSPAPKWPGAAATADRAGGPGTAGEPGSVRLVAGEPTAPVPREEDNGEVTPEKRCPAGDVTAPTAVPVTGLTAAVAVPAAEAAVRVAARTVLVVVVPAELTAEAAVRVAAARETVPMAPDGALWVAALAGAARSRPMPKARHRPPITAPKV